MVTEEEKRKDKVIEFKSTSGIFTWFLYLFKDPKKIPYLSCPSIYDTNKENLNLYVEQVCNLVIDTVYPFKKEDTFLDNEIYKLAYHYIKLELLYNRNGKSEILDLIKHLSKKSIIEEMVKSDIKEITSSTFGNIEAINLLKLNLQISSDLLNPEIIKCVSMCKDAQMVGRIDKELLDKGKRKIEFNLENLKKIIDAFSESFQKIRDEKLNKRLKSINLCLHTFWLLVSSSLGIVAATKIPSIARNIDTRVVYKTEVESISSLGESSISEEYLSDDIVPRIMEVYSEVYLEDGLYYRDVREYDFSSFETTSSIEKYFNVDVNLLNMEPINEEKIRVSEEDKGEYKVLKNVISQDKKVKKIIKEDDNVGYEVLMTLLFEAVLLVFMSLPCMPIDEIKNIKKIYKDLVNSKIELDKALNMTLEYIEEYKDNIKNNSEELKELHRLIEELESISYLEKIEDTQEFTKFYEIAISKNEEFKESESFEEVLKLLKKYKKM